MLKEKFEKEISELEEMAWSFRQRCEQHYSKKFYLPATSILKPEAHLDASANHTKARLSPHKEDTGFFLKRNCHFTWPRKTMNLFAATNAAVVLLSAVF